MATKMTYSEQLKHPFWQRKRWLQVLERSGWSCEQCGATEITLHIHHKRYIKGAQVWEYEDKDLTALCEGCHASEHEARALIDEMLARCDIYQPAQMFAALIGGYLGGQYSIDDELEGRAQKCSPEHFDTGLFTSMIAFATLSQMRDFVLKIHDEHQWENGRGEKQVGIGLDPAACLAVERWESAIQAGLSSEEDHPGKV